MNTAGRKDSDDFAVLLGKLTAGNATANSVRPRGQALKEASTQIEKLRMKSRDYTA